MCLTFPHSCLVILLDVLNQIKELTVVSYKKFLTSGFRTTSRAALVQAQPWYIHQANCHAGKM